LHLIRVQFIKVTANTFLMPLLTYYQYYQIILKKVSRIPPKYEAGSTTVFNLINKKCFLSSKSAY